MGIEALTHSIDGARVIPVSDDDWRGWVSATASRNYVLGDPLIDWLGLYGEGHGFQSDDKLEGYDLRTDFSQFVMRKGTEFETAVVEHLATLVPVFTVAGGVGRSRDLGAAEDTFAALRRGEPVVYQAVLRDADSRTYGTADLLVRSDHLRRLFPDDISAESARVPAPDLGAGPWHYRVVDVKFTTLRLLAGGGLGDGGSAWTNKLQVHVYNRALGRMQGYLPPEAYLLGRGWQRETKGETFRGTSCMDMLVAVPQDHVSRSRGPVAVSVDAAYAWVRRVRGEGAGWRALPEPSVPELRPNMKNGADDPWHAAKRRIGAELQDPTMLWQVGVGKREIATRSGVLRWSDPACTAEAVGITGPSRAPTLDAMLDVNRSTDGPLVRPSAVRAGEGHWRPEPPLEFYVDFETVSDLDDDFTSIPEKGGQPLIFIIGCGHVEEGEWRWSSFVADALKEGHEAEIIDAWFAHMEAVTRRLDPDGDKPYVFHWSHAEESTLETAFNSAKQRHPEKDWGSPRWFDFLMRVVKAEPVVVRGAFGFGLKAVAKAMSAHGLIETDWDAGPTDGLGAMVGAWSCAEEAGRRGCKLADTELMGEVARYNEVDCKVMMEIVRYLRAEH